MKGLLPHVYLKAILYQRLTAQLRLKFATDFNLGDVYTISDNFCAGTKTISDGASVDTQER